MNNNSVKQIKKAALASGLLSTLTLFSSCVTSASSDSDKDLNRAMVTIGDECIAMDIDGFIRWYAGSLDLFLKDGTVLNTHTADVVLYNNKSEIMKNNEAERVTFCPEMPDSTLKDKKIDRAIINYNDELSIVEITSSIKWSEGAVTLYLVDGSDMTLSPLWVTLYSSESPIMNQVEQNIVKSENVKSKK